MVKLPNWKELKKQLDDPQRREELRESLQRGAERGRDSATKRLAGPAAHLRNVGSQFKSGLGEPDAPATTPTTTPATAPAAAPALEDGGTGVDPAANSPEPPPPIA